MIFIETTIFTKQLFEYFSDEEYQKLQSFLIKRPHAGNLMRGTGGLRKIRWQFERKGKRGGLRIIYHWNSNEDKIHLITLYSKSEKMDLTRKERKTLKNMLSGG